MSFPDPSRGVLASDTENPADLDTSTSHSSSSPNKKRKHPLESSFGESDEAGNTDSFGSDSKRSKNTCEEDDKEANQENGANDVNDSEHSDESEEDEEEEVLYDHDEGTEESSEDEEDSGGGGEEYVVERIESKRIHNGREEYLIKWKDWPETDNTWEPRDNLSCPDLLERFEKYWAQRRRDIRKVGNGKYDIRLRERTFVRRNGLGNGLIKVQLESGKKGYQYLQRPVARPRNNAVCQTVHIGPRSIKERILLAQPRYEQRGQRNNGQIGRQRSLETRIEERSHSSQWSRPTTSSRPTALSRPTTLSRSTTSSRSMQVFEKKTVKSHEKALKRSLDASPDDGIEEKLDTATTEQQPIASSSVPQESIKQEARKPFTDIEQNAEQVLKGDDEEGKSNNVSESEDEVTGFARGLEPQKILGVTKSDGKLMFLIQWKGSNKKDLVLAEIANHICPQLVIRYYEQRLKWTPQPKSKDEES